jgi:HSP20 family protein
MMKGNDPRHWMWAEACAMLDQAERLRRQFFQPDFAGTAGPAWEPPVDILQAGQELRIVAALPGVAPQDLQASINGEVLTIAGVRRLPQTGRGAAIQRLEIPHGRFERRIRLPSGRMEVVRSELASGCLFLSLNKRL